MIRKKQFVLWLGENHYCRKTLIKKKNNLKSYCICCFTTCFVFVIIFDEHFPGQGSCQDHFSFQNSHWSQDLTPSRQGGHFAHSRCAVFEAMGGWLRRGSSLSPSPIKTFSPSGLDLALEPAVRPSVLLWQGDILAYWLRFKVEWWELP